MKQIWGQSPRGVMFQLTTALAQPSFALRAFAFAEATAVAFRAMAVNMARQDGGQVRNWWRRCSEYPPKRSGVAEGDVLAGVRNPFR